MEEQMTTTATATATASSSFEWTAATIVQSLVLFVVAGLAEILGGWMVWVAIRGRNSSTTSTSTSTSSTTSASPSPSARASANSTTTTGEEDKGTASTTTTKTTTTTTSIQKKPWWYAVLGSLLLVVYGFIPCLQPTDSFGRIYAAYGGFFIVLSFLLGWALDGDKPDLGDVVGGSIALVGVLLLLFWPR